MQDVKQIRSNTFQYSSPAVNVVYCDIVKLMFAPLKVLTHLHVNL